MNFQSPKVKFSIGKQYFFSTIILFGFISFLYNIQDVIGYQTVSLILLLIIFLLPIYNFERGPIIVSAIISALAWDYYFIPPHFTMHIDKPEDVVMLFMFLVVALTNGVLTSELKKQKNIAYIKEWKLKTSYSLLKVLSGAKDLDEVCRFAVELLSKVFSGQAVIYFPADNTRLNREPHASTDVAANDVEWLAAEASFIENKETGRFTNTVQSADGIYFPIRDGEQVICVAGVIIAENTRLTEDQISYLRSYINDMSPIFGKHISYSIP